MTALLPIIFADWFDRLRLQLPDPIVNWLTPVWIMCVGAAAGLILCAALWGAMWLLSRMPGIGTLADQSTSRRIGVGVVTVILFLLFAGLYLRGAAPAGAAPAAEVIWPIVGCLAAAALLAIAVVTLT